MTGFSNSYRGPLWRKLKDAGYNIDYRGSASFDTEPVPGDARVPDPDHDGYGGYLIGPGTGSNIDSLLSSIIPAADADVIILNIGTNDFGLNETGALAASKYLSLVHRISVLNPTAKLILWDFPPSIYDRTWVNEVRSAMAYVGNLSPTDNYVYVPMEARLTQAGFVAANNGTFTSDGLHPTLLGSTMIAQYMLPEVAAALNQVDTGVPERFRSHREPGCPADLGNTNPR